MCSCGSDREEEMMSLKQAEDVLMVQLKHSRERVLEEMSTRRPGRPFVQENSEQSTKHLNIQSRTSSVHRQTVRQEQRWKVVSQGDGALQLLRQTNVCSL